MDAGPIKDSYTLDYTWAPDGRSVSWTLVKGQIQRAQNGSYVLPAPATQTTVTYSLAVDLNIPMIGMLRRKAEKVIIDTALKGLKRRVESASAEPRRPAPIARLPSSRAGCAVHRQGRRRQDDAGRGHRRAAGPLRAQGAGRLHRPGALARRRAGGRAGRRADRAGARPVRRAHRHPRAARRLLGRSCRGTCARCWPAPVSTSWWPTS